MHGRSQTATSQPTANGGLVFASQLLLAILGVGFCSVIAVVVVPHVRNEKQLVAWAELDETSEKGKVIPTMPLERDESKEELRKQVAERTAELATALSRNAQLENVQEDRRTVS